VRAGREVLPANALGEIFRLKKFIQTYELPLKIVFFFGYITIEILANPLEGNFTEKVESRKTFS